MDRQSQREQERSEYALLAMGFSFEQLTALVALREQVRAGAVDEYDDKRARAHWRFLRWLVESGKLTD